MQKFRCLWEAEAAQSGAFESAWRSLRLLDQYSVPIEYESGLLRRPARDLCPVER